MHSLEGQPVYSDFLFPNGYGIPHGPLSSDDELWNKMDKSLQTIPIKARQRVRERMPSAAPFAFSHGELTNINIIVRDGNLAGILDWEASGYFPVWWEFACAGIGLGQDDFEWKTLLRRFMPDYNEARKFWSNFYALCRYPKLDERGEELLEEMLKDQPACTSH
jgi:aminoglycoside phosphotransferase (APT) family kinase protein